MQAEADRQWHLHEFAQLWIANATLPEMRLGLGALATALGLAPGTQRCQIPLSVPNMQVNRSMINGKVVGFFGGP